jgi:hypothetical protein
MVVATFGGGSVLISPTGPGSVVIAVGVCGGGCTASSNALVKKGGADTPFGPGQSQNVVNK